VRCICQFFADSSEKCVLVIMWIIIGICIAAAADNDDVNEGDCIDVFSLVSTLHCGVKSDPAYVCNENLDLSHCPHLVGVYFGEQ